MTDKQPRRCRSTIAIGEDFTTFRCDLPSGHSDSHKASYQGCRGVQSYVLRWQWGKVPETEAQEDWMALRAAVGLDKGEGT